MPEDSDSLVALIALLHPGEDAAGPIHAIGGEDLRDQV
jgi:hypothetical protein